MAVVSGSVLSVDFDKLSWHFDLSTIDKFSLVNFGCFVISNFENTFNFCCELKTNKPALSTADETKPQQSRPAYYSGSLSLYEQ